VILMLAARQERLPDMLLSLKDYREDVHGFRAGKTLLRNLKNLLVFWQEHYLHKDKVGGYKLPCLTGHPRIAAR
jgi:Trpc4-associated protein